MARTSEQMVREMQVAFDQPCNTVPQQISDERRALRLNLIVEEVVELIIGITGQSKDQEKIMKRVIKEYAAALLATGGPANLIDVADGVCDSHVVISGTSAEFGIPEDACYAEVHASNMAKADGPVREDGKRMKPPGWMPPNIAGVLARHGYTTPPEE